MLPLGTNGLMLFIREKIAPLKSPKEMASFLIVENASLAIIYSEVCTAYMMYITIPVTVARQRGLFLHSN